MSQTADEKEMEDEIDVNDEPAEEEETTPDEEEITLEQAQAWKQEIMQARKKIAFMSKEKKAQQKDKQESKEIPNALDEDSLDELLERRDFYKNNTAAKALKEDIESLYKASKGKFSREDIYGKLSGDAEIEENRKVYAKSSVSGKQSSNDSFIAIDMDKYDAMTAEQQKAYNAASKNKFGGVKFKD